MICSWPNLTVKTCAGLAFAVALAATGFGARGAEFETKDEALQALIEIESHREIVLASFGDVDKFTDAMAMMTEDPPPPEVRAKMTEIIREEMEATVDIALGAITDAYGATYTKDDMETIIDFYRTPVGQKMTANAPDLARAVSDGMADWFAAFMPRVQSRLEALFEAAQSAEPAQ